MYLNRVIVTNIRSVKRIVINLKCTPGWNVIIGDNGSGKSTLVRSIALCLSGPIEGVALRQNWSDWLSHGARTGRIRIDVSRDATVDKRTGKGKSVKNYYIPAILDFRDDNFGDDRREKRKVSMKGRKTEIDPQNYFWGSGGGWFSASYGPYRRFAGGDKNYEKLFYSNPKLARHLSVFGEDVALSEALDWVKELHILSLEERVDVRIIDAIKYFINQSGLLPHETKLVEIKSDQVVFQDGNGSSVPVDQLSDGYRSILSMSFDLIRSLVKCYGYSIFDGIEDGDPAIKVPGVVIIDEIDAHLHPTWQSRIGNWLTAHFPNIQFIVTSHSPIVCQAASQGTIWKLSTPGGEGEARQILGMELDRLLYGSILDAYDTSLFGQKVTRSEGGMKKLKRIAELNIKSLSFELNQSEIEELAELRSAFPIDAAKGLN